MDLNLGSWVKLGSKAARPSAADEAGVASKARMTNEIRNVAKIWRSTACSGSASSS